MTGSVRPALRVVCLTSVYPRTESDTEVPWLRRLMKEVRVRGVDVRILAPSWKGLHSHDLDGVRVHRFRYAPFFLETLTGEEGAPARLARRPWMQLLAVPYIVCGALTCILLCLRHRPHVLHANWPFPHALMALPASRMLGIPLVNHFYGAELRLRTRKPIIGRLLGWLAGRARLNLAISRWTATEVRSLRDVHVHVVPYGAASQRIAPGEPHAPPNGPPVILFVGRHVERKGISVLLLAMERLQHPQAVLVIVGEGDQTPALRRQAASSPVSHRITFTGRVSAHELSRHYESCTVFCLPSIVDSRGDTEGLGTVLLEATEHLRPVVCSDVGGIPDVVIQEQTGLLVPPGDPNALALALDRVLADPGLATRLAAAGREHARRWFAWDRIASDLERHWRQAAGMPDPGG